jgi:hypothetical protein
LWENRLRECNSVRSGQGWAEPEVWFRIRHMGVIGGGGDPMAAYHEQTVEIALGSKGAFGNCGFGVLTRHVPADRVVSAVSRPRQAPKPPREPRTPRVVELFRKAIEWQSLIERGEVTNKAELARREGITRARVTQVMGMLHLAPKIQAHVLGLPAAIHRPAITERALRPIAQLRGHKQLDEFRSLLGNL